MLQKSYMCVNNSHVLGWFWVFAAFIGNIGYFSPSFAQDDVQPLDLAQCVNQALKVSPSIQAAQLDVQIAETQLSQARNARILPKFDLTWMIGPSPEARGNPVIGDTDFSKWSVFTRTEATLIQPLFTFGKLAAAQDVARGGIDLRDAGLMKSRGDLELQVAKAYYGLLLMNALKDLSDEAGIEIQKARKFVDQQLEDEVGEVTETDLARIDRFVFDVKENANKVVKGHALASAGMRKLLGLSREDPIDLAENRLNPVQVTVQSLGEYLTRGKQRPELKQLEAGIAVRSALSRVAKSDYYPQFFFGGQFKYAYAPNRDNQSSPFARDDFNFLAAGAIIGFQQSLAFGGTSAKVKKARLEHQKLEYQTRLAGIGVDLEIEKLYLELKEAQGNMAEAQKARRATRRWFISARDGFNAGLGEASDVIDAVKEYGIIRAKYLEAVFNFNMSWARLQKSTGYSIVHSGE